MELKQVSASALKSLAKSPEHCYANHIDPNRSQNETDAMLLGTLVHAFILEPKTIKDLYIRTPDGMVRRGQRWEEWKRTEASYRKPIKGSIYDKALMLRDKVRNSEMAMSYLMGRKCSLDIEERVSFNQLVPDGEGGRWIRMTGFLDLVNHSTRRIVDIKTVSNADDLSKCAKDGRWDLQAVQYLNAMQYTRDYSYRMFFLVVETNSPHRIRIVELSPSTIHVARQDHTRLTLDYVRRMEEDDWTGDTIQSDVDMPAWFTRELEDLNEQY